MASKSVDFRGYRGQMGDGPDAAHISVRSGDEWLFVEEVAGVVQVWSGPPCKACRVSGERLRRCQLHAGLVMMAEQLRLVTGE